MNKRRPYHSINFVIAHDGFTLRDLVSYNLKVILYSFLQFVMIHQNIVYSLIVVFCSTMKPMGKVEMMVAMIILVGIVVSKVVFKLYFLVY